MKFDVAPERQDACQKLHQRKQLIPYVIQNHWEHNRKGFSHERYRKHEERKEKKRENRDKIAASSTLTLIRLHHIFQNLISSFDIKIWKSYRMAEVAALKKKR